MRYSLDIKVKTGIGEMVPQLSTYIAFPEDTNLFYIAPMSGANNYLQLQFHGIHHPLLASLGTMLKYTNIHRHTHTHAHN